MAQTLEQARKLSRTSIHGRRLGLDHDEFLVGVKGTRLVVTNATSASTGTVLPNHGHITIHSTAAKTWSITDPEVGCEVSISLTSSSTLLMTVTPAAATFSSSGSTTGASVVLQGGGTSVTLIGLTTGIYGSRSASPGSTYIDFTT